MYYVAMSVHHHREGYSRKRKLNDGDANNLNYQQSSCVYYIYGLKLNLHDFKCVTHAENLDHKIKRF